MKNLSIVITMLLLFTACSNSGQSIEGTWKLLEGTVIQGKDTLVTDYTQDREMIKIINDKHFAFLHHDLTKGQQEEPVFVSGGGRYTLHGDKYTEHLDYCNYREWENHVFEFTVKLTGDTLITKGIEKVEALNIEQINIEVYIKIFEK